MYKNISIILFSILLIGCSAKEPTVQQNNSASSEILKFKENVNIVEPKAIVKVLEAPIVQKNDILTKKTISFSAENVNLRQALYAISKSANLNLMIDNNVDINNTVTLSLNKVSIQNALDHITKLGECSYTVSDNILYIHKFVEKTFNVPYSQSLTNFDSKIGGDILGSTKDKNSGEGGLNGSYGITYKSSEDSGNYYKQLESNLKDLMGPGGKYSLNKMTGILVVYDTQEKINRIEKFITQLKKNVSRQIVIDAKILEVVLNDSHQLGVDWNTLPGAIGDFAFSQTLGLSGTVAGTLQYNDRHMSAIMKALDTAGEIDALSNPKITVSSGQSALISSGKIVPFWEKEVTYTTSTDGDGAVPIVTYKRRDILDGLSLGVTPIITDDGKIILNIVPITSNIEETMQLTDPSTSGDNSVIASAPILSVKEAGTVVYAKNNQVVMIGGMISNVKKNSDKKIPGLGNIPGFGKLFTQTDNSTEKRELVILLKLNIVED